jgi:hypothetical protein
MAAPSVSKSGVNFPSCIFQVNHQYSMRCRSRIYKHKLCATVAIDYQVQLSTCSQSKVGINFMEEKKCLLSYISPYWEQQGLKRSTKRKPHGNLIGDPAEVKGGGRSEVNGHGPVPHKTKRAKEDNRPMGKWSIGPSTATVRCILFFYLFINSKKT